MNQKPVDDEDVLFILRYLSDQPEEVLRKEARQIEAHYQKKYLGLLPEKYAEPVLAPDGSIIDEYKMGYNQAIKEAIANIGGDLG